MSYSNLARRGMGDIFDLTTVSTAQVAELNGRVQILDNDIQNFSFVPGPSTTPDQFASAAAAIVSLRLRWQTWRRLQWDPWVTTHSKGWTRLGDSAATEFGLFQVQYNTFRDELINLGGHPVAPRSSLEQPTDPRSALDKTLEFLNSVKWIAVVGLTAYVIVGTGAVQVVRRKLATSNPRRRIRRRRR